MKNIILSSIVVFGAVLAAVEIRSVPVFFEPDAAPERAILLGGQDGTIIGDGAVNPNGTVNQDGTVISGAVASPMVVLTRSVSSVQPGDAS